MDSGKQLATRSLGKGEICRRLKPLLVFFSYFSTYLYLPTPTPPPSPTAGYNIPSSSPNPTLLPKPRLRNPRETRTGHTLKFPSNLRSNPNGRHTCDRHAANLLRFVHAPSDRLQGWGISFRCTTCMECRCRRYTIPVILYYTPHLYPDLHSTHSFVCLMYT